MGNGKKGQTIPDDGREVKIRWNGFAFYEIVLPNGKVILTDPYQYRIDKRMCAEESYVKFNDRKASDTVSGCDYVLLTHAHMDHAADLPDIMGKYHWARLVVPDTSAAGLLIEQGYNTLSRNIQIVGDQDKLVFDDFSIECYRGRHTILGPADMEKPRFANSMEEAPYWEQKKYQNEDGSFNYQEASLRIWSTLEFRNYKIITKEGLKIFIWGGQISEDFRRWQYTGMKPDVMLVQIAATNVGNSREHPDASELAGFISDVEPQLMIPIHQEKFTRSQLDQIGTQCEDYFASEGKKIRYLNPQAYQWYSVSAAGKEEKCHQ